jgi:acyl-coenzyme A thioesterase PaaI-like protein
MSHMVNAIKTWWNRLSSLPFGKWIFSRIVGLMIPYTGTTRPNIEKLAPGFAEVFIKDERRNRNHLRSIHALALGNLGELTTGLALHFALAPDKRAILTNLNVEFLKKARGIITARANIDAKDDLLGPTIVHANLSDHHGNVVAKVTATWLVGQA